MPATDQGVLLGLPLAVIPEQTITLGGGGRLVAGGVAVEDFAFLVGFLPQRLPRDPALGDQATEGSVLAPCARQDGDEPALALMEIGHVLARGELAISHVEKVAPAGQLAEQVPSGAMGLIVGDIAAGGAEVQRHATVGGDSENEQELL